VIEQDARCEAEAARDEVTFIEFIEFIMATMNGG